MLTVRLLLFLRASRALRPTHSRLITAWKRAKAEAAARKKRLAAAGGGGAEGGEGAGEGACEGGGKGGKGKLRAGHLENAKESLDSDDSDDSDDDGGGGGGEKPSRPFVDLADPMARLMKAPHIG